MAKRSVVIGTLLVAISLFLLDRWGLLTLVKAPLVTLTKPLQAGVVGLERQAASVLGVVSHMSELNSINRTLALENAKLQAENAQFSRLTAENKSLSEQLKLQRFEQKLVRAHQYGLDPETKELLIRTDESVMDGDMVVLGENYIGKVIHHTATFAKVQLPTDPHAQIPVITSKGVRGITTGRFRSEIIIDKLTVDDSVQTHDIVRTSGEGTYLKDLVVGEVAKVTSSEKDLFKQVTVTSLVPISLADTLFVVRMQ